MSEKPNRPSLPTSSTDFALPPSSSSSNPGSPMTSTDDTNPLLLRFRRPSILAPKAAYFSETRLQSPLVASFTLPSRRRRSLYGEESESDRMWTDSSPSSSSENPTPPLGPPIEVETDKVREKKGKRRRSPLTPPRNASPSVAEGSQRVTRSHTRRPSGPVKQPRILNLLSESRPEENEVKSEAAFQRLIASGCEIPMQPRTPRAASDRGRYPEEAGHDESQREDTPSDDDAGDENTFAFLAGSSDVVDIAKPCTPANSVNGDEMSMLVSESPGGVSMDIDMPMASPSVSNPPAPQWRYTPPPTTSAIRSNKRKFDDRFDPYSNSSKRRAVSPSISYFRGEHSHSSLHPRTPGSTPRLSIPISIPTPTPNSATSSPTVSSSYATSSVPIQRNGSIGHMSVSSSPTMRSSMGLASPVIRPVPRTRRIEGEEREVEGAGEAVGGLTLS